jgi:integrase
MTKLYKSSAGFFFKYKATDGCWKNKAVPVSHVHDEVLAQSWADDWMQVYTTTGAPPVAIITAPVVTVGTAAEEWLNWKRTTLGGENKSWRDHERFVRLYLRPHKIARCTAEQLNVPMAVAYIEWVKEAGVAAYTQRNIVSMMRQFVSDLRGKGFLDIKENPFLDPYVKKASPKGASTYGDTIVHLSPDAVMALVHCNGVSHANRVLYATAYGTGMRAAEMLGLRWDDIDLDAAIPHLKVQRQLQRGGGVDVIKPPKKGSHRSIPLHSELVKILRVWRSTGVSTPFGGANGSSGWAEMLRDDLATAGLASTCEDHPITFHALRRSFMSALSEAGANESDIGTLGGHKQKTVTGKHYIVKHLPKFAKIIATLPWPVATLSVAEGSAP